MDSQKLSNFGILAIAAGCGVLWTCCAGGTTIGVASRMAAVSPLSSSVDTGNYDATCRWIFATSKQIDANYSTNAIARTDEVAKAQSHLQEKLVGKRVRWMVDVDGVSPDGTQFAAVRLQRRSHPYDASQRLNRLTEMRRAQVIDLTPYIEIDVAGPESPVMVPIASGRSLRTGQRVCLEATVCAVRFEYTSVPPSYDCRISVVNADIVP